MRAPNPTMSTEYDSIIIGAGPAGTSCALYAAQAGLRVLLLDRERFPREKVCGDFLPRRARVCLQDLGLLACLEEMPHVRLQYMALGAPSGSVARIPFCPPSVQPPGYVAYVCRRFLLDAMLVEAARSCVDVSEGFVVEDLLRHDGAVIGVRGRDAGGTEQRLTARVVVGADGNRSIVARRLGLYALEPRHRAVALRGYFRGVEGDSHTAEVHFLKSLRPGYLWIFPAGDGLMNVGVGMLRHTLQRRRGSLRRLLHEALHSEPMDRRFNAAECVERIVGWDLPLGSLRRTVHGDGFVLAGDAAGLVNPFSGEGIGNAMWSGRLAAQAVAAACAADDASASMLRMYSQQLWEELGPELKLSHQLQRLGRVPGLLNLVLGRAASRPEVADWVGRILCGVIPKSTLRSPLTYLRLLFQ